jgi:microcystin-dependent protein
MGKKLPMGEQFISTILIWPPNFAPSGWALCAGQLMAINQNQALFSLLGTTYGGDGISTFGLPDLRGRIPLGAGQGTGLSSYNLGQTGGSETVTLTTATLAAHTHSATPNLSASAPGVTTKGTTHEPSPSVALAAPEDQGHNLKIYSDQKPTQQLAPGSVTGSISVGPAGGGQPHENRQPFLAVNYIIALQGIFPSRS